MAHPPSSQRSNSHGRSHTPSSASRKSQSAKTAVTDAHSTMVSGSLAAVTSNKSAISTTTQSCSVSGGTTVSGASSGGGGGSGGAATGGGGGAPVVLMMQHNGQTLSVLVDPLTLQVLNPAQSAPNPSVPITPSPVTSSSDQPVTASVGTTSSKKSKKGSSQRAIFPKPKTKAPSKAAAGPKTVAASLAASTMVVTSVSTPLMITTEASGAEPSAGSGVLSEVSSASGEGGGGVIGAEESQDILAKATLSIWTMEEMNQPLVCSPTNDDNPLLIDTSAPEGEEDRRVSTSPRKGLPTPKTTPVLADRTKKGQSLDHRKQSAAQQQQRQQPPQLQDSDLLLQPTVPPPQVSGQEQCVGGRETGQELLQEQEEQQKLQQQEKEQHDQLMRLESQMVLTSPSQPLVLATSVSQPLAAVSSSCVSQP